MKDQNHFLFRPTSFNQNQDLIDETSKLFYLITLLKIIIF